jgi:hypothetical protein
MKFKLCQLCNVFLFYISGLFLLFLIILIMHLMLIFNYCKTKLRSIFAKNIIILLSY